MNDESPVESANGRYSRERNSTEPDVTGDSRRSAVVHRGNSVISIETLPDYSDPVVVKRPSEHASFTHVNRLLDREYEMTRSLDAVEGVRKALGQQSIDNQPALILEHIEGETLRDHIAGTALDLRSRLEIAIDLARVLGDIHRQGVLRTPRTE